MNFTRRDTKAAFLFIMPYVIGFVIFLLLPLIASFVLSFTDVRFINKIADINFIGLDNYIEAFTDTKFLESMWRSLLFTLGHVPTITILGLLLAMFVNARIFFRNGIRAMLFMPYVSNIVAIAIVWSLLLEGDDGVLNNFLRSVGFDNPPNWLWNIHTSLLSLIVISVWAGLGFVFVVYLAALQGVPAELKEAAAIDGAKAHQVFRYVTIPYIAPTTLFVIITTMAGSLKNYSLVKVMTDGGPGVATEVMPLVIVETAFGSYRMGYASAQAIVLFLIIATLTITQWKLNANKHER